MSAKPRLTTAVALMAEERYPFWEVSTRQGDLEGAPYAITLTKKELAAFRKCEREFNKWQKLFDDCVRSLEKIEELQRLGAARQKESETQYLKRRIKEIEERKAKRWPEEKKDGNATSRT